MDDIEIITTHLYIKFKPVDEEELDMLKSDSTLTLYTYPLDVEIIKPGDFYHDPELPIEQPTYQYCAVRVDKVLPNVEYEILEELFIPDEHSDDGNTRSGLLHPFMIFLDDDLCFLNFRVKLIQKLLESFAKGNSKIKNKGLWKQKQQNT